MAEVKTRDFDESTAFLGDYGHFQILIIVLLSLGVAPCGYMGVIVVFVSDTPKHHCKVSMNFTRNSTGAERASRWIGPDGCSRYKVAGNETERCVDGWEFSTEIYSSTIVSEWDLVCENAWKVPFSTSIFYVGVLIGSLTSGHISDRFGRKLVVFAAMFLQAVTILIQATSIDWVMFCILSCVRGFSQISIYITSMVLGLEMLSQSARLTYAMIGHSVGFGLGYALLPLVAYFSRGWRMLLVAGAIPSLLFLPAWWVIPESPRWLLQKGRVKEAEIIIRNAAKRNRVPAPELIFTAGESLELIQNNHEEEHTYTYLDLIRTPNMRNITILGVIIWILAAMVYYGICLSTSNLHGNVYLNCFFSAAIEIAASVATWLLAARVPRPTLFFSAMIFCGILLLIIQLVPEDLPVMFQVLVLVGKVGVSGAYSLIYVIFNELLPTVVRNMGLGVVSTSARVGAIICPFVIYAGVYNETLPYIIFGTFSLVAAALSMVLPDTRNSKLPDLICEVKPIRSFSCLKESASVQSDTRAANR